MRCGAVVAAAARARDEDERRRRDATARRVMKVRQLALIRIQKKKNHVTSARAMPTPTPVNVVTGALGAGKTTTIARALAMRPANETWAVVVNEFGALGIDGALLDDAIGGDVGARALASDRDGAHGGVVVREVNGGCVCCATAAPFTLAVTQVIRRYAPARVLVEPSGMGDAGRVIDALRTEHLKSSVDIRATLCVVDVREFGARESGVRTSALFAAQCECADALVGSFADCATADEIAAFEAFGRGFWPKKAAVVIGARANVIDARILDVECGWEGASDDAPHASNAMNPSGPFVLPRPTLVYHGEPWMLKNVTSEYASCGYAFHADDVFVRPLLKEFFDAFVLRRVDVARFKGIMRVGADWVRPDIVHGDDGASHSIAFTSVAYRRDSRFELIRTRGIDADTDADEDAFWNLIREKLLACRKPPRV